MDIIFQKLTFLKTFVEIILIFSYLIVLHEDFLLNLVNRLGCCLKMMKFSFQEEFLLDFLQLLIILITLGKVLDLLVKNFLNNYFKE